MLVTLVTLIAKLGAFGGASQTELIVMQAEIKTLREWRHTVGNFQTGQLAVEMLIERVKRLESKVFNGGGK